VAVKLLRRLPVYGAGAGFTVALVAVAKARDWSGWLTFGVAVGVLAFYVVTILVPWLIREQLADEDVRPTGAEPRRIAALMITHPDSDHLAHIGAISSVQVRQSNGTLVILTEEDNELLAPRTQGSRTIGASEPQLVGP
jgi:hypothetical protein